MSHEVAPELMRTYPLKVLKPPVEIPGFTICQGRHEIHRNNPGHRWPRDALCHATEENSE